MGSTKCSLSVILDLINLLVLMFEEELVISFGTEFRISLPLRVLLSCLAWLSSSSNLWIPVVIPEMHRYDKNTGHDFFGNDSGFDSQFCF